jgi:hypothetical protein
MFAGDFGRQLFFSPKGCAAADQKQHSEQCD